MLDMTLNLTLKHCNEGDVMWLMDNALENM